MCHLIVWFGGEVCNRDLHAKCECKSVVEFSMKRFWLICVIRLSGQRDEIVIRRDEIGFWFSFRLVF